jgi:hypothetical protein
LPSTTRTRFTLRDGLDSASYLAAKNFLELTVLIPRLLSSKRDMPRL